MEAAAEELRRLARVARKRNGRLEIDWISRRQKPRWKLIPLNSQWYDRRRLRNLLDRRPKPSVVPASRRRLTQREIDDVQNDNPWRLF